MSSALRHRDTTPPSIDRPLLHPLNKVRSSHVELIGDIDQAFKGDPAATTFDSLENDGRKPDPLTEFRQTEPATFPKVGDPRTDVTTPLRRKARSTGSP